MIAFSFFSRSQQSGLDLLSVRSDVYFPWEAQVVVPRFNLERRLQVLLDSGLTDVGDRRR